MPIQLPGHEPGLEAGLSSWLGRLVTFVNALEVEVRGRQSLEQLLIGRQDAVAQQLRQQIGAERTAQQQVAAGLRGQLDEETRARIEASQQVADIRDAIKALEEQIEGLGVGDVTQEELEGVRIDLAEHRARLDLLLPEPTPATADQSVIIAGDGRRYSTDARVSTSAFRALGGRVTTNAAAIAQARAAVLYAARFPVFAPCDHLFVGNTVSTAWTLVPGNFGVLIQGPPTISGYTITLSCNAYGVRVTSSGISARLRLRPIGGPAPTQSAAVTNTAVQRVAVPITPDAAQRNYILEYRMTRPSGASDLDGLVVAYILVEAIIS